MEAGGFVQVVGNGDLVLGQERGIELLMFADELCEILDAEDAGTFQQVVEFPDIAGEGVGLQCFRLLPGKPSAQMVAVAIDVGDEGDVLLVFPQGRRTELDDAQPLVEIQTECAVVDHGGEVPVGGGDDADVHRDLLRALAYALETSLF